MVDSSFASPADLSLNGRLRFLLKDAAIYGGAAAISKAFALITFPLLARHFSVAEYGVLDYYLVLASLLAIFFIFGQDSAVARFFYEHEHTAARRQLISQSLVFQLAGLALLLPLLWLSADWLTTRLIAAPDSGLLFKIVLLQLPFLLLINFSQNLLKWTFARTRFLTMSLGFTVVQASLLVIAVLVFEVGILGVLLVSLTTSTVFGALGLFFVRQWLVRPRDFQYLREMLPFAIPCGLIGVAGAFSPVLERNLTHDLLGVEELGLYAAATKIAMVMGLLVSAFQTAWGPFSLALFKQVDAGATYNWAFKLFALGACVAALLITLLAHPLIQFLATDRYSNALIVVFPLAMGHAIQATSRITVIGIAISKRSYLNLYANSVAIAATLAGIWFLAPLCGLLGIGLGVLLGHIVTALISSWMAQRAYRIPWHYSPVILLMSVTLVIGLVATSLGQFYGRGVSNLALVAGLLSIMLLGWGLVLNKSVRQRVATAAHNRWRKNKTNFTEIYNRVYGLRGLSKTEQSATSGGTWGPRDGAKLMFLGDTAYLIGGWGGGTYDADWPDEGQPTTNQVYRSLDFGVTWTRIVNHANSPSATQFSHRHWFAAVNHTVSGTEYMYMLNGDAGDVNQGPINSDVRRSTDGITWTKMNTVEPGYHGTILMTPGVLNGVLYLIGGQSDLTAATATNVVWRSLDDGVTWTSMGEAPWSPRFGPDQLVEHDGKLWLLGGGRYDNTPANRVFYNDVWAFDGRKWEQILANGHNHFPQRAYHNCFKYDGWIYIVRGSTRINGVLLNNSRLSHRSRDGVKWESVYLGLIASHADGIAVHSTGWLVASGNGYLEGSPANTDSPSYFFQHDKEHGVY